MFKVFARTWYRENSEWPDGLEPFAGKKYIIHKGVQTEHEAQVLCREWNSRNKPGKLSKKAEYTRI